MIVCKLCLYFIFEVDYHTLCVVRLNLTPGTLPGTSFGIVILHTTLVLYVHAPIVWHVCCVVCHKVYATVLFVSCLCLQFTS